MRSLKALQSRPSIIAVVGVGCFVPRCGRGTGEWVETISQWMRSHMTLHPKNEWIIPAETVRVARAAFPKGNVYMMMRDQLGQFYYDQDFQTLFRGDCGQSALSPGQLALITIMQFAEGLTDRQTADAVRGRLDWKYALGLELTDCGFDFSVLSEFRDRLLAWEGTLTSRTFDGHSLR